jgi:O-antigen/teichoic acid export membrane protein
VTSGFGEPTAPQARLRDRALKAGSWTLAGYGVQLCFKLFSNLVLTRLLFPEAFGAVAVAAALISGLVLISDFGVRVVIVQSPRGDEVAFLRSAWMFQLWRGVLLWMILVGLCALIGTPAVRNLLPTASVFAYHSFPLMTACLGFTLVLDGAQSTCIPLNARRLNYRPIVIVDLAARMLSIPVMIIWAWIAPSVWALVGGTVVASLFQLVLSHAWVPGPLMGLNWEKDHLREIVRFGRWIAVSSFATFIYQQCDLILLGILMPGSVLGLYSIAKLLVGVGEGLLERLGSTLALPIFAEIIRKNPSNLLDRYYRFRLPMELMAALLGGGLLASGNFIVNFLYDPRYAQAGLMLQILAVGTVFYPLLLIRDAFNATGDTHVFAFLSILRAVSLVVCLVIGFVAFGAPGAIGGVALHRIIPSVIIVFLARQRNWIGIWQELRIIPVFILGLLLGKAIVLIATELGVENIHQFLH